MLNGSSLGGKKLGMYNFPFSFIYRFSAVKAYPDPCPHAGRGAYLKAVA